jgi:hypothetical protein
MSRHTQPKIKIIITNPERLEHAQEVFAQFCYEEMLDKSRREKNKKDIEEVV